MAPPPLSAELAQQAVDALAAAGGNMSHASVALGISRATLQGRLRVAAGRGLVGGIPAAARPPEGFEVSRNSMTLDADGNLLRQSVQTKPAAGDVFEMPATMRIAKQTVQVGPQRQVEREWIKLREDSIGRGLAEVLAETFSKYDGAAPLIAPPSAADADIMTVYPIPDLHFGMYSWGAETGADYDVEIASRIARNSVGRLVAKSDPSETAVILGLGDLFHCNDQKNATPGHGHRLDADGRWARVFDLGARLLIDLVNLALQKHRKVHLVLIPGNHDEDAAVCLRVAMALYFSSNPRVEVYKRPGRFWYHRFGLNLYGATHGDKVKPGQMPLILATDRPKDWGETVHRHFYFGHIHHDTVKEFGPVRTESFQTPAGRDGHAEEGGYRSGRSMSSITYHITEGEIERQRVNIIAPDARAAA